MTDRGSAREALIAEALGEMATLLDRMEAMAPALEASRLALIAANEELAAHIAAFESRMLAVTESARTQTVKHIARRTEELIRRTGETETRALQDAARVIFRTELDRALQRLVSTIAGQKLGWRHLAVTAATSLLTVLAVLSVMPRPG